MKNYTLIFYPYLFVPQCLLNVTFPFIRDNGNTLETNFYKKLSTNSKKQYEVINTG